MEELRTQKCPRCKALRKPTQFVYNEKQNKCCIVCRDNNKKYNQKQKEKKHYAEILDKMNTKY